MRRALAAILATLMVAFSPVAAAAATIDVLVFYTPPTHPSYLNWDDWTQAESDADIFIRALENSGVFGHKIRLHGPVELDIDEDAITGGFPEVLALAIPDVNFYQDLFGTDLVLIYTSAKDTRLGYGGYDLAVVRRGSKYTGAHELGHFCVRETGISNEKFHEQGYCTSTEWGVDSTVNDCSTSGKTRVQMFGPANAAVIAHDLPLVAATRNGPVPPGNWLWTSSAPEFEFQVRITGGNENVGVMEADCIAETACFSGALPGRVEVQVKFIGPRPNGYLWAQIMRSTPSKVEVWARQIKTGEIQYYLLPAVGPESDDVSGLQDRTAFLPSP